jgi:hypothetical protein
MAESKPAFSLGFLQLFAGYVAAMSQPAKSLIRQAEEKWLGQPFEILGIRFKFRYPTSRAWS